MHFDHFSDCALLELPLCLNVLQDISALKKLQSRKAVFSTGNLSRWVPLWISRPLFHCGERFCWSKLLPTISLGNSHSINTILLLRSIYSMTQAVYYRSLTGSNQKENDSLFPELFLESGMMGQEQKYHHLIDTPPS